MKSRKQRSNRKVLIAVPLVWSALAVAEAAATAATDGGQADASADSGTTPVDSRDHVCSVAGSHAPFGTALGAGCC